MEKKTKRLKSIKPIDRFANDISCVSISFIHIIDDYYSIIKLITYLSHT